MFKLDSLMGRNATASVFFYSKDILTAGLDWIFYIFVKIYRVVFFFLPLLEHQQGSMKIKKK